jgi:protein MpaA
MFHLIIAGIHGEEPETTFLLSRTLRFFYDSLDHVAFIYVLIQMEMALGTRGNQRGVDLNRNFLLLTGTKKTFILG